MYIHSHSAAASENLQNVSVTQKALYASFAHLSPLQNTRR